MCHENPRESRRPAIFSRPPTPLSGPSPTRGRAAAARNALPSILGPRSFRQQVLASGADPVGTGSRWGFQRKKRGFGLHFVFQCV